MAFSDFVEPGDPDLHDAYRLAALSTDEAFIEMTRRRVSMDFRYIVGRLAEGCTLGEAVRRKDALSCEVREQVMTSRGARAVENVNGDGI
ncbi:MAG: hypothetical protein F8N36_13560 [Desulfovibrio sp.]|uniref:hypothetical protein n=1 Tax=Desulfovibrio sp. TaxID=885 RepID=UPI00135E68EC|nr:hypothetical protein [Desulfovibrio sp.]MTJ93866.1 hypothetical protein [Desulfovibrio sp.]